MEGKKTIRKDKRCKLDLFIVYVAFFMIFAGGGSLQQYIIPFLKQHGIGWPWNTLVLATLYLSFAAFRLLNLYLLPHLPPRMPLTLGLLTYTLLPGAMLWSNKTAFLLAAAVLWGWGASAAWMTSSLSVTHLTEKQKRGKGAGALYAAVHAGFLLGVPLIGALSGMQRERQALHWVFWITTAGSLVSLGTRPHTQYLPGPPWRSLIPRDKDQWIVAFVQFASSLAYGLMLGSFAALVRERVLWSATGIYTLFYAFRFFLSLIAGETADRLPLRTLLIAAFFLSASSLAVSLLTGGFWGLALGATGLALQVAVVPVACLALVGQGPAANRARRYALSFVGRDLGVACALLTGLGLEFGRSFSLEGTVALFAFVFLACSLLCALLTQGRDSSSPPSGGTGDASQTMGDKETLD